ncbi:MAG: rhodanese-like domain-containing protein [Bacillota bacterium]
MWHRNLAALVLVILILLAGCAQKAEKSYQNVNAGALHGMIQNEKDIVLVDVREPFELEETGYIPGSVNIPVGQVEKRINEIPRDKKVVIICRSGRRSAEAAKLLTEKGYTNIYNLEGGIASWSYNRAQAKKAGD